jgi:serine/threonine protein phosphatase PrpC
MSSAMPVRLATTLLSQGTRASQEDFALVDADKGVFVLADGFGGPYPGSSASKAACEGVKHFLRSR